MLSALLKKQLQEIFRSYFYNAKQGKARSSASTVGYRRLTGKASRPYNGAVPVIQKGRRYVPCCKLNI